MIKLIYVGTDWHLWKYSKKAGRCVKRPDFDDVIKYAENTLSEDDFIIYLGDLTDDEFSSAEKLVGLLKNVKGYKILVRGNNDTLDDSAYLAAGFDRVVDVATLGNLIFTHRPVYVGPLQINIHGHNHGGENEFATAQNIDAWAGKEYLLPLEDILCGNEPDFSVSITDHFWTSASPKHEVLSGTIFDLEEYYINGIDNAPVDESVFREDNELEVGDLLDSIEESTVPKKEKAINYLRKIKYLTEAFYSEELIGDVVKESLEMMVGKKPVTLKNGMVTLYHASPEAMLRRIKAASFNVGTRLSSPRTSSFWADDPAVAIIMGIWKVLTLDDKLYASILWMLDFKEKKFIVSNKCKSLFIKGVKDKHISLYVATVPLNHVGKGHDPDINEYSVDIDVFPHHESLLQYDEFMPYVRFVSESEFARMLNRGHKTNKLRITPRNVPFRDKLIYHGNFRTNVAAVHNAMDKGEAIGTATYIPVFEAAYNKTVYDYFFDESTEPTLEEVAWAAERKLKKHADKYADAKKSPNLNEKLYPVYITIFSNDTSFGKLIRKATGSDFSHATISLDPTMNNMYSFSDVPYNHARLFTAGFVRESLWSTMYTKNRYFKILVTFVNKEGRDKIQKRIDYFIKHHDQYEYNDIGLIRYYFKFKDRRNDETKKMKWFCSEFVAGAITASEEVTGFENLLASPSDLQDKPNVIDLGKFTIPTFDEKDLIRKTDMAEKVFRANKVLERSLMVESIDEERLDESWIDAVQNKVAEKRSKNKDKFNEKLVNSYTYNLDWKKLYDVFIKLFPKTDPTMRFDLFELIVRNDLVKNRKSTNDVMGQIIDQTETIANKVKPGTISVVDIDSSTVFYQNKGLVSAFRYPSYEPVTESAVKSMMDEVLLQDFEDAKDFETDDDVSRAHQDPDRQATYRVRFRKRNPENQDVPTVDEAVLTESKSVIELSLPLMQPEMEKALAEARKESIQRGWLPSPIEEAARIQARTIRKGEFDKAHRLQKAKKRKDPLAEASPFEGKFKSVKIDEKSAMIVIKGIDYRKMMARLKNMYDTKKVNNLFDVEYTPWSLYLYNSEQIEKADMKIKNVKVPLFFALELQQIFYDLADYYQLKYYAELGNEIYKKTWISNVDKPVQRNEVNMGKLKTLFTIDPLPYQIGYVQEYFTITRCYNFDGHILTFKPGYGKTFTAVMIAEASKEVDQVVVVCPNTLKENWANELRQYYRKYAANEQLWKEEVFVSNNTKFEFVKSKNKWVIVNQESIPTIFDKVKSKNVMIVVDECQYFRNYEAKRSAALLELKARTNATEVLMMSGTPIHATPDEALTALLMIDPMMNLELAKKYKKAFSVDNTSLEKVINARFGIIMYDVPTDVLKLPAKHEMELKIKLDKDEKFFLTNVAVKIAESYRKHYAELGENAGQFRKDFEKILKKYSSATSDENRMYTQFIDDGASYLSVHESKHEFYRTFIKTYIYPNVPPESLKEVKQAVANYAYMSAKARGLAIGEVMPPLYNEVNMLLWTDNEDFFIDKIKSNLKKTLIFSPYVGVVDYIADRLKAKGIGTVVITGSVVKNRQDRINEFCHSDMIDVMVATHNVAGTGLTLIEASQVFFFGVPFRSAEYDQAANRVYRIGQTSEVYIYKVLLDSSVDKVANITTRQNDIMEWSRNMSTAYTKGAKTPMVYAFEEEVFSESAIQRACAQYDEYNLDPFFGKETAENQWNSDYDDAYSDDEVEFDESIHEATLEEKVLLASKRTEPIFVCLFHFSSVLSTLIAAVTKDEYSHATISFDTSLKNMYSFGKMYPNNPILGSFVHESLYGDTYNKVTKHAVYVVFVTPEEKEKIKRNLDWFIRNSDKLRYNYEGLLKSLFKIPDEDGKKKCMYLCSEFVSMMLKSTGRDLISTPSNLVKPNDFQFYPWCYYLGSGTGRNYNRAAVDKRLREIIEKREAGVEAYLESIGSIIDESLIFSKDRLELNLSNWAPGKNNILYVTGLSGSGKTTYSEELEKAGEGVVFELDGIFLCYDSSNRGIIKRLEREDDDYKYHTPKSKVTRKQFKRWINSVIRYMHEDPETKYIVEGVQIYEYPGPLVDLAHDPVVIIGTSILKSIYRRIKRAESSDRRNQLRELRHMVRYYLDEHKMFTHFVKNATTNESTDSVAIVEASSFSDIKRILSKIPKEEHKYLYHNNYVDSPNTRFREVIYKDPKNKTGGAFIEAYVFPEAPDTAVLSIGAEPSARGLGLTDKLVKKCLASLKKQGISVVIWRADVSNKHSIELAKRSGFIDRSERSKSNDRREFEMVLSEASATPNDDLRVEKSDIRNENDKYSDKAVKLDFYDGKNRVGEASIGACDTEYGFLYDFEAFEKYRGNGYANRMMEYILANYSVTDLTVSPTNTAAIKLYKKFGFKYKEPYYDKVNHEQYDWYRRPKGKLSESWEESMPTDVDGDDAPHIDGTHKDFMMKTDPTIGDIWDEYDDPITETSTLIQVAMSDGVAIKIRPGNTLYYTAEDLRFFVAWLDESYHQLLRMLRTSEVDARAFANIKIIRAWMTKFYILANPSVDPSIKEYAQLIADSTDKLMRSYMERCVDMGISLKYLNDEVEPIFNVKKESLENFDIINLADGEQGILIHI